MRPRNVYPFPNGRQYPSPLNSWLVHPASLAGALLALALFSAVGYLLSANGTEMDRQNCIIGRPLSGVTDLVIDKTDNLTDGQQANLRGLVQEIVNRLSTNERINIYVMKSDNSAFAPERKFSMCKPDDGSKSKSTDILNSNPALIRAEFERSFSDTLRRLFLEEIKSHDDKDDQSPIIEMIESLASAGDFDNTELYDEKGRKVGTSRLILFSDMLQHVNKGIDHYKHDWRIKPPEWGDKNNRRHNMPDLKGVNIEIYYLPRRNDKKGHLLPIQGEAHKEYWREFFAEARAFSTTFLPLPAPVSAKDNRWSRIENGGRK